MKPLLSSFIKQRPKASIVCVLVSVWMIYEGIHFIQLRYPNRNHPSMPFTQNMQTLCAGRLLIDVPADAKFTTEYHNVITFDLADRGSKQSVYTQTNIPLAVFNYNIEKRWKELQEIREVTGEPVTKPSARINVIENGIIFVYEHELLPGDSPDKNGAEHGPTPYWQSEGYLWRDGTVFTFEETPKNEKVIEYLMKTAKARKDSDIPVEKGLCIDGGFFAIAASKNISESVLSRISLPKKINLSINTTTVDEPAEGLLSEWADIFKERAALLAKWQLNPAGEITGEKIYRKSPRDVGELAGEEVMGVSTVGDRDRTSFQIGTTARWAYPGRGGSHALPHIELEYGSFFTIPKFAGALGDFPGAVEAPDYATQLEFESMWDAIVASIRIRPGAF